MRAVLLVAALATIPLPDILPVGHKDVLHELVLQWDEAALPWRFVASPVRGFHGHRVIRAGEPFSFSSKYGTCIFAAPPDAELPPSKERLKDESWPRAKVPVREVRSIAIGHPLARVETTLRVVGVTADTITFERAGERRFAKNGSELGDLDWLPLAAIAAAGAFWLWRLDRPRRPPAPETA